MKNESFNRCFANMGNNNEGRNSKACPFFLVLDFRMNTLCINQNNNWFPPYDFEIDIIYRFEEFPILMISPLVCNPPLKNYRLKEFL